MSQRNLLPVGFYDLIFEEAEKNHQNINRALDTFFKAKYRLIKPTLVQFNLESIDNLSKNIKNSFFTIDVISGNNLVFRNDITPQIARLLSTRLQDEKLPIKLCYVGDVLCAKNDNLYSDRQQTQLGFEIIGCNDENSDLEAIETLFSALNSMDLGKIKDNLFVEFSLPGFLSVFLEEITKKSQINDIKTLKKAIIDKNLSLIEENLPTYYQIIKKIITSNYGFESLIDEISSKIKSAKITQELENKLSKIGDISSFLNKKFPKVEVRFDILCDDKNTYHSGLSFDIFYKSFSYPIARGGRYKISKGSQKLPAIGGTIYVNNLRKITS